MHPKKISHFRWYIVFLLFLIAATNYIDRSAIAYVIEHMRSAFHLSQAKAGLILGGFGIGYMITTFIGGIAVDRYGPYKVLFWSMLLWSIAVFLIGFATGFTMVFWLRVLLGLAEGPSFPAITKAIGNWLPQHERTKALSYFLIAVPLSLAFGAPLIALLAIHFSWQTMFKILGIFSLIWLPIFYWLFRNTPKQSPFITSTELNLIQQKSSSPNSNPFAVCNTKRGGFLFTEPTLLANYWAFFVFGYFLFFFMNWLPSYLAQQYHLQLKQIGLFTILPWTLSAILMLGVGYLSDFLLKKTQRYRLARSYLIALSQLLAALCVLPILFSPTFHTALISIALALGFSMSANGIFYVVNLDIAQEREGSANGTMIAIFSLSGFLAPALTGWLVTLTGHFTSAFILLAGLALSSVIVVLLFHFRNET